MSWKEVFKIPARAEKEEKEKQVNLVSSQFPQFPLFLKDPGLRFETKSSALPIFIEEWNEEFKELYEERAAILEFEGDLERTKAERIAEFYFRDLFSAQLKYKH